MTTKLAPRNTHDTIAWEQNERRLNHHYPGQCLILQRKGRGIPPLAPTAFTASQITPASERVFKLENLKRGMKGFSKGSNPAGHIFEILGRRKGFALDDPDGILTLTNDVPSSGHLAVVPFSFYHNVWNHTFQFGATWLNGYDFADFNKPPKPVHPTLGANYQHAIADVKKALKAHKGDGPIEALLQKDLERMQRRLKRFS